MEQFEHQAQLMVDSAKDGRIPEQVRVVAEESVKRIHEAYTSLSSAAQEGTERWQRVVHANYKTAREMERKCLQNTATNVDAAFAAARSKADTSFPDWLKWVLGALALAVLAWWLFGKRPAEIVAPTTPPPGQVTQNLTVDGVDVRSTIQTALDKLKTTLQDVSDVDSAKAALPNLTATASQLDKVRELSGKLPVDGKSALAALVTAARPSIDQLFDKVLTIPGVDAVAKPAIDALRAKLDTLSKA